MEKPNKRKIKANLKKDKPGLVTADDVPAVPTIIDSSEQLQAEDLEGFEERPNQELSKKEKKKLKKQMKEQKIACTEDKDTEGDKEANIDLERLAQTESDYGDDDEDEDEDEAKDENQNEKKDEPLSEAELDSDSDVVPYQKLTINNGRALRHSLERIQLPWSDNSFDEHISVTSQTNTGEHIKDICDDAELELAFYRQALSSVNYADEELRRLKIPFKRPLDYFAEMVKSDEHMDKIKSNLIQEASEKRARQDARRQRELKKFGKQVQVATLQKRQLEKTNTLNKIKALKKKRKQSEIGEDEFNVSVEELTRATSDAGVKRSKSNHKREAKNKKYGQGGMKRFKRKNDADSSADVTGFSHRKMKGRPGKSRRQKRH